MKSNPAKILIDVVERLSMTTTLPMLTAVVAEAARKLSGADGTTFVLRDEDKCFYADETAISPLWKGKRFPLENCISGWSMNHRQVVIIQDIYQDARIPHDAYRPTFVKSLCMVPIRIENPLGVIGTYWANGYIPNEEEVKLLQVLANSAAIALENLQLREKTILRNLQPTLNDQPNDERQEYFETAIHTIAHDLRNPLSTMLLFAELLHLKLEGQVEPKLQDYLNSIIKSGRRANEQIRKMLSIYTVNNRELELEKVNLSLIIHEISEQLKVQTPYRKVQVEIEPDLNAVADPHLIRLALDNLMSNAFKYTAKKEQALIHFGKVKGAKQEGSFYLQDNGDGFDSSQSQKLFRPLVRLHGDDEFTGVGLGLASAARIIELHGGTIRAEAQKSHGATFFFELPSVPLKRAR